MKAWIARDKDGELYMFSHLPILCRNTYFIASDGTNSMKLDRNMFPEVTFEESPKKLKIKIIEDES